MMAIGPQRRGEEMWLYGIVETTRLFYTVAFKMMGFFLLFFSPRNADGMSIGPPLPKH